jgi:hypothetical protein
MNNLPASAVLSDMRIHRQHGLSAPAAGQHDVTTDTPVRRVGWRRRNRGNAQRAPGTDTARGQTAAVQASPGETMAAAMQLAIALLTAGLDSAELEAWAADALTPDDADGLANLMIGLHVVSALLLNELHEATGEPSAAILQKLAILAEYRRGTPSTG